jgi:hypothetical protein
MCSLPAIFMIGAANAITLLTLLLTLPTAAFLLPLSEPAGPGLAALAANRETFDTPL